MPVLNIPAALTPDSIKARVETVCQEIKSALQQLPVVFPEYAAHSDKYAEIRTQTDLLSKTFDQTDTITDTGDIITVSGILTFATALSNQLRHLMISAIQANIGRLMTYCSDEPAFYLSANRMLRITEDMLGHNDVHTDAERVKTLRQRMAQFRQNVEASGFDQQGKQDIQTALDNIEAVCEILCG